MTTEEQRSPEFVDDDEPVENIRAAFRRSEKAVTTKRPRDVNSLAASIDGDQLVALHEVAPGWADTTETAQMGKLDTSY